MFIIIIYRFISLVSTVSVEITFSQTLYHSHALRHWLIYSFAGNIIDKPTQQQSDRILSVAARQHDHLARASANTERPGRAAREDRPRELRQLPDEAADSVHRRRLLRRREQPADLRDGEDRIAGLHGSADTHLRPSLKIDDRILSIGSEQARRDTDSTMVYSSWRSHTFLSFTPDANERCPAVSSLPTRRRTASIVTKLRGSAYDLGGIRLRDAWILIRILGGKSAETCVIHRTMTLRDVNRSLLRDHGIGEKKSRHGRSSTPTGASYRAVIANVIITASKNRITAPRASIRAKLNGLLLWGRCCSYSTISFVHNESASNITWRSLPSRICTYTYTHATGEMHLYIIRQVDGYTLL